MKQACILFLVMFSSSVYASGNFNENGDGHGAKKGTSETEIIQVVGEKFLVTYKKEMRLALYSYWDVYNSLIEEEKFKVICRQGTDSPQRLRIKICEPKFVTAKRAELTQYHFIGTSISDTNIRDIKRVSEMEVNELVAEDNEQHMEIMANLVETNKELKEAFLDFKEKEAIFKMRHAQVMGEGSRFFDELQSNNTQLKIVRNLKAQ